MQNALLIGLSQQAALRREMTVIANNLANMNTSGFKSERLLFEEYVMPVARDHNWRAGSNRLSYVQDGAILRNFEPGRMKRTGNPLDVAINGKGWFVVQTPDGEQYTRNGHFNINADGTLTTSTGNPVLIEGGLITFRPDETDFSISRDGMVSSSAGQKGRLRIVEFENENKLKKQGNSLLSSEEPGSPAKTVNLIQGMLEDSNVKPVVEMTRMIEVQRAYTRASSMLDKEHELMRDTINKLGRAPN
jgi:flagellar basal-body rod protein FlgF